MAKLSLREVVQSQLDKTPIIDGQLIICTDTGSTYRDIGTKRIQISKDLEIVSSLPLAPLSDKIYYLRPDKLYSYVGGDWVLLNSNGNINDMIAKLPVGSADATDDMYYIAQDSVADTYTRRPASKLWNYIKSKAQEIFAEKSHTHTKTDVGLGNVDNTADKDKSVKAAGTATKADSATSSDQLSGLYAKASQTWGNQTGTFIHGENDSTGGSFAFRRDNPKDGQMSMIIDGRFYQNEGQYRVLDESDAAGLTVGSSYGLKLLSSSRPANLNVSTKADAYRGRVTYDIATSSTTIGKPPTDAHVLTFG